MERQELRRLLVPGKDAQEQRPRFVPGKKRQEQLNTYETRGSSWALSAL
jgi:hypothetical protein